MSQYDDLLTLERWTPPANAWSYKQGAQKRLVRGSAHRLCVLPDGELHVFRHISGRGKNRRWTSCLFVDKHLPHFKPRKRRTAQTGTEGEKGR